MLIYSETSSSALIFIKNCESFIISLDLPELPSNYSLIISQLIYYDITVVLYKLPITFPALDESANSIINTIRFLEFI